MSEVRKIDEHTANHEGAHMSEYVDFSTSQARQELAEKLSSKEYSKTRRMGGLGIYTFALGDTGLTFDQLVDDMARDPNTEWLCIDEHSGHAHKPGTLCPHTGCGAAKGVHAAILAKPEVAEKMRTVVGDAVDKVLNNEMDSDTLGLVWANALQTALAERGVNYQVEQVGVERHEHNGELVHSATAVSVHFEPDAQSNEVDGKPNEKPFFYTAPSDNKTDLELSNAAHEAVLAGVIAFDKHHGLLGMVEGKFAILVRGLKTSEQRKQFEQKVEHYISHFKAPAERLALIFEN